MTSLRNYPETCSDESVVATFRLRIPTQTKVCYSYLPTILYEYWWYLEVLN
ncbi:hypothetical protein ES707_21254 [subsurface metagenome]